MSPSVAAGDHHRHDRQSVEAVGQVDRIAESDDDERAEQQKAPAEIEQVAVDERHGERARSNAADQHQRVTGDGGDDIFGRQPRTAGKPAVRLPRHLQVVVVEADRGEAECDKQGDPDIGALEIRPKQRRGEQAEQDHQAAHRGRALLGQKMRDRPVEADRLPLALLETERRDDRRSEEEDEEKTGSGGPKGAEGEVAEEMECVGELRDIGEPGQHGIAPKFAAPARGPARPFPQQSFRSNIKQSRVPLLREAGKVAQSAGWGVESRNAALKARSAVCANLPASKRRAIPHPSGFAGHLPQQSWGRWEPGRRELCMPERLSSPAPKGRGTTRCAAPRTSRRGRSVKPGTL